MLLPSIVLIDHNSPRGNEDLSHLEDVLTTLPQPILIVIEVGVPDCMTQYRSVVRTGGHVTNVPHS
jgi:hypothetical protein